MANENIQELKFQVGEAWKGVYSSSTAYGLANVVQDPTGLSIYRSLKSGNVGHPLSDNAWWFCIIDMSSIKAESDRIAALNQAIAEDEALRKAAEELRQQHEAERVAAETQRNENEQARISAEQQRVNKESQREAAEQQRITAEQGRVSTESARVQAEQARVLAETLRANAEDQRAANEQNRVAAEQQRIERAEQDHQRAESDHATYVDSLGAFDISSYHATDGVLAKYADLAAALGINGANIPDDLRKGGMSVKFVQSSDNKYVQYRLTSDTFNTTEANWQRENDNNSFYELNNEYNSLTKMYSEAVKSLYLPFVPNNGYKLCVVARNQTSSLSQPKYQFKFYESNLSGGVQYKGFQFNSNDYVEPESKYATIQLTSFGYSKTLVGYLTLDWSKITDGSFNNNLIYDAYKINPTFILSSIPLANLEEEINQLGQEMNGLEITFEAGSVNYLNGQLISDGKSIRTVAIPISKDVRITGHFPRTLSDGYIVKYLNGVYAGYENISVSGMNINQLLQKDATFDSFRLRVVVPHNEPDWTAQDILNSSAPIYVQNSVAESVQEIENRITSTPSSLDDLLTTQGTLQLLQRMSKSYFTKIKKQYADLNNLSVGSTFIFQTSPAFGYTYEYISVEEGDVIILSTSGNTVGAKAYAIIDAEDKVLAIHQEALTNAFLVMPTGAKKFVANTNTSTNKYALIYIMGKTADYDSVVKQFDLGEYSFKPTGNATTLSNGPIPSGSIIMAVTGSNAVSSINLYDENGENHLNLPISSLPYTTTRDYYKASTYIPDTPLLTIVTAGIEDAIDELYQLLQKLIDPITKAILSKKYSIANHDNDFSFDNLFAGQFVASLIQLQRNFEIPCEGACISTDVENVTRLSEPVTDEQMLKANAPYLYIDGVKRGTIVLFDTDGTPFIYDNTGTKRYLTLL